MANRKSWLFAFLLTAGASPLAAREVAVLQFGASASKEATAQSFPITNERIAAGLREHFATRMQGPPGIPTRESRFGGRAEPPANGLSGTTQDSGIATQSCDGARYVPTSWLTRAEEARRETYFSAVARIACAHGLSTHLLDAVVARESGYSSRAISAAGAMGMMQIMPGTARALGLVRPFDAIANMHAGARYLRQQLDRFGRVDLALAAYNAGPERRSLRRGAIPRIPETITYVRAITTNWARLAELGQGQSQSTERTRAAMVPVNSSPYRSVELVTYD